MGKKYKGPGRKIKIKKIMLDFIYMLDTNYGRSQYGGVSYHLKIPQ